MPDRERLIEILKLGSCPSPYLCDENCKYANLERCYEERTADLLLEHGVVVTEEAEKALDVSEVVRCKNCKNYEFMKSGNSPFCNEFGGYVTEKDFCSRAQKMDGGT